MALIKETLLQFVLLLATVSAKLSCEFFGVRDQVCKAGKEDYVLARGIVSDNNHTTGVTLRDCKIIEVELESFENLHALKFLDLSKNKIRKLELGVFDGLRELTNLNLSHNLLTDFPLGVFDQNEKLEILDLKENKITNIELGIFDPLEKLKHVDLSSNELLGKNFDAYVFDKSPVITVLDFSRNDMRWSPNNMLQAFTELEFLNLDRCFLTEIPSFATKANLRTLKHLMLSTNRISKITSPTTFKNLDSLEIINLGYNIIEEIHQDVFKQLINLKKVVLRNNNLKMIPDTLLFNMKKVNAIDLSHNKIEEVPVNAFRGTSLSFLNLASNRFSYLQDNFCLELKNSGARVTKFFFNQNPWQCSCLLDVLNEVKKMNIAYNTVKYNGKEPVCVVSNDFNCMRQPNFNDHYVETYDSIIKNKI